MSKKQIVAVLMISAVSLAFIFLSQRANRFDLLLLNENVEALAQDEGGQVCAGTKDAVSRVIGYGFYYPSDGTSSVEFTIAGHSAKVSGPKKRKKQEPIPYAVYDCQPEKGYCCMKQGLYSGENRLA